MVDLPPQPDFRLDGLRALVTGAGRGIGLAGAAALAGAGAEVTLCARTAGEIEAAADAIRAAGGGAEALPLDVTDIAAMKRAVGAAGPFDILLNNAGRGLPKDVRASSPEDFDALMDVNVRAAFFVAQTVAEGLIAAGRPGSLIHMSSQLGKVGAAGRALYVTSKWALEGMSKAFALDLAGHGIRSNTIAPTFVETPFTAASLAQPEMREWVLSQIPLGRVGRVGDIAGAILYLAAPASALVTGSTLSVDGGWTAS